MTLRQAINSGWAVARRGGWMWVLAALMVAGFWLHEHDARAREQAALAEQKRQTSAQVASLERQAASELKAANQQNARAVARLEGQREKLEEREKQLRAQLKGLRANEQARLSEIAELPIGAVENQLERRLGRSGVVESGSRGVEELWSGGAKAAPEPRPATRGDAHLRKQARAIATATGTESAAAGGDDSQGPAPQAGIITHGGGQGADLSRRAFSEAPPGPAAGRAVELTSAGARKVDAAFVELDACRAERANQAQQLEACAGRAAADEAAVQRQASSIAELNQALEAKERAEKAREGEARAELRAARGTFFERLARTSEHVAIGVAIGLAAGVAIH